MAGFPLLAGANAGSIDLTSQLQVFADDSGQLTINEVASERFAERFEAITQPVFSAGFTLKPHWFRIQLPAADTLNIKSAHWYIRLTAPLLDEVDFYLPDGEGGWQVTEVGDQRPFSQRPVSHPDFVQPVELQPQTEHLLYMRVQTQGSLSVPLSLVTDEFLWQQNHEELLLRGAFYGLMLGMLLYNLLILIAIRDWVYFGYLMTLICAGLITPLSMDGLGVQYLWGEYPGWVNVSTPLGLAGTIFWASMYTRAFCENRARAPLLDWQLRFAGWIAGVAAVLAFVLPYSISIRLAITVATGGTALIWLFVLRLMMFGDRAATVYTLAFTPIMLCGLIKTLESTAMIASNFVTVNSVQIGMGFAVIGLSLVLADKYNREREERVRVSRLKRFFSPEVATAITTSGAVEILAPTRRHVVTVFADMRGFTAFAARTEPDEVLRVLSEYHEICTNTANRHQGTLEHFVGDGVMICFNAPVQIDKPEHCAMRMALDLHRQFETLVQGWEQRGHSLGIGMSLAAGEATVGVVGRAERQDYTTIGTVANLASRLCDIAAHGEILVPASFAQSVSGLVQAEARGKREIKGIPAPVLVYALSTQGGTG